MSSRICKIEPLPELSFSAVLYRTSKCVFGKRHMQNLREGLNDGWECPKARLLSTISYHLLGILPVQFILQYALLLFCAESDSLT